MSEQYNILLVDDDPIVIAALGGMLQELGQIRFATSGLDALRLAGHEHPDVVLLDLEMPGMSGFEVCTALKESPLLCDVPVIFITSSHDEADEVRALSLGAVDFVSKPPRPAQVLARVRIHLRMKHMNEALRRAAATDPLTGLANRRQFDEALHREWLRSLRACTPLSLLMMDLDFFKKYNDRYGHLAGDQCLQSVAQAMRRVVHRPTDVLARYGGEEFALLLPDTNSSGACAVACYVAQAIDALRMAHDGSGVADHVTLSVGATAYDDTCEGWISMPDASRSPNTVGRPRTDLIAVADRALYAAKLGGRNHARFLSMNDHDHPERAIDLRNKDARLPPGRVLWTVGRA